MPRPILFLLTRAYGQLANQRLLLGARPLPATYLRVFGVTKNSSGVAIGYCAVHLFRTTDDVEVDQVISDAAGNYEFRSASLTTTYYVVAYKASGYRATALATVPAGYWRFGEASGTVAADEMGVSPGTYVNTPTLGVAGLLTGDLDTAATFAAASSERVDFGTGSALAPTTSVTMAAWLTKAAPPAGDQRIFSRRGDPGSIAGYEMFIEGTTGRISTFFGDGTTYAAPFNTTSVCDGVRHFVVAVRSGAAVDIYLDGVVSYSNATVCAAVGSMAGTITAQLGAYNLGGYGGYLTGTVDEPAVWTRGLSATEVLALYTAGSTVTTDLSGTTVNTLVGS